MTNPLAKLDKATHMLAEAKTLDEIKNIMDVAEAARTYARAAKLGLQAYNHAAEIKVRAERKAGEFLKRLERKPEGRPSKLFHNGIVSEYSDVLKEYAIPTTSAHRWQGEIMQKIDLLGAHDPKYKGAYLVRFENTDPQNGRIMVNKKLLNRDQLIEFLQFKLFVEPVPLHSVQRKK